MMKLIQMSQTRDIYTMDVLCKLFILNDTRDGERHGRRVFKSLCGQGVHQNIRTSGNLILNLLKLMLDGGINEFHAIDLRNVTEA
jgi:hypothetical protein